MFIQGHSAVSIRFLLPIYMSTPYCHSAVSIRVLTTPCTSPCCHSAVSICILSTPLHVQVLTLRVPTTPLHVQIIIATVLCQYGFLLPLYMYRSLLPQFCVNKGSYYPMYKSLLPQCCVNMGSYYPSACTSPYCHSAVSIWVPTTPLHVQVLTATVLCQYGFLLPLYMYKSLLPQCCVNKGYYYPTTCTCRCRPT